MKAIREFIFFALLFITTNGYTMNKIENLNVIPVPQQVQVYEGVFKLEQLKTYSPGLSDVNQAILEELTKSLSEAGMTSNLSAGSSENASLILNLDKSWCAELEFIKNPDEAYKLEITKDKIFLTAQTEKGLFYGITTLMQIIEKNRDKQIPVCTIIDYPDLKIRGISDDISRGQVSNMENLKRIIRFIARYKMNTYMPYIEDLLEFDSFPAIGKGRGALSKTEVKELVEYAARYYVEVIPVFQTLGHYENILSIDEFVKYAEFPGAASLCIADESIYTFLETMLKEVFELFPSKYFHMGADESYHVGMGRSKKLVEESSLAEVHAMHYKRVYDICKKYGKEVMMYGDIILSHAEILELIPKDITIVDWHYSPAFEYPSAKKFKEAGFNYIASPSVWNFVSSYPFYGYAVPNIKYMAESGIKNNSLGLINSNWGDYGAESIKETILAGYAWSAQCAWSFEQSSFEEFFNDFSFDFLGISSSEYFTAHEILSNQYNQVIWHDMWRHPLLPFREPGWWESRTSPAVKYESINSSMQALGDALQTLKTKASRNKEFISVLELAGDFLNAYQLKLMTQKKLHDSLAIGNNRDDLTQLIDKNIHTLSELRDKYQTIWLSYYKPANLNMVVDKFNRLIKYFEETKDELSKGKIESPVIKSPWIYCSDGNDGFVEKATFQYSFDLTSQIDSAKLQLIGDSYARLFINDKFVDQVFVRRSGSLWIEYKRVKLIDIKGFLKPGANKIVVEAENFGSETSAGVNIIGEIYSGSEVLEIQTGENWLAMPAENTDAWISASVKENRLVIPGPDFKSNRASWIER